MVKKFAVGLLVGVASYGAVGYMQDPIHSKSYDRFNQKPTQFDVDQARRTAYDESRLVREARDAQLRSRTSREWLNSVDRERKHQSHQWQADNDARMLEDQMRRNRIQEENLRREREQEEKRRRDVENVARDDAWRRDNTQQGYVVDRAPYYVPVQKESARLREARERAAAKAKRAEERRMAQKEKEAKGDWMFHHYHEIEAQRLKNQAIRIEQMKQNYLKKQEVKRKMAELRSLKAGVNPPGPAPGSMSDGKASLEERRKAAGMNPDGTINYNLWR